MSKRRKDGTLQQCLKYFVAQLGGVVPASRKLVKEMGVTQQTASQWLRGVKVPYGLKLIKLEHFLEREGYVLSELASLSGEVLDVRRLLANDIVLPDDAVKYLEYVQQQSMWRVLRGESALVGDKLSLAQELVQLHDKELQALRPSNPEVCASLPTDTVIPDVPPPKTAVGSQTEISVLAHLLLAVLPLAQAMESDAYTESEREKLRHQIGEENFFALSNVLNRLSGPRARAHYRGEQFHDRPSA